MGMWGVKFMSLAFWEAYSCPAAAYSLQTSIGLWALAILGAVAPIRQQRLNALLAVHH